MKSVLTLMRYAALLNEILTALAELRQAGETGTRVIRGVRHNGAEYTVRLSVRRER